ncbi:MAG: short-chain dehydrogenase [Gemmatimonadales bacterium]|nr:MAG: short-chain dehydrogenase [Gemmatimonadales bacterium]
MELQGRTVLLLGGAGLVGQAVARRVLEFEPGRLVVAGLLEAEAKEAVERISAYPGGGKTRVEPFWGDLFVPAEYSRVPRREILGDPEARARFVDDLYGELTDQVFQRSALGRLLMELRPHVVVDSINTAGALAYQDAFRSAADVRKAADRGEAGLEEVESHLATLYLPQLIRHTQISLEGMTRAGTRMYVKIGTAGTGGMGLNVPFTHSEERPSRVLLAKASLAGAQSLLLFLMARTPGAPAVKEIKPTAAISWKAMGTGPVKRGGQPVHRSDARRPLPLEEALAAGPDHDAFRELETTLDGVWVDSGENGYFAPAEFEALTALGLMEFVTPEEIAENVIREIRGIPTGRDIVAALDGATMGPTYRAGTFRSLALSRMEAMEEAAGVEGTSYEMLGPPRLSKLLFEAQILRRMEPDLSAAAQLDPESTASRAQALVEADADLRQRIVTIGLPILLPDARSVLRGPRLKVRPQPDEELDMEVMVDRGWVDLRAVNWRRWRERIRRHLEGLEARVPMEAGSAGDHEFGDGSGAIRPGRLAGWIFRYEDRGERIKR